ncbi:MAG: hypothetical protein ACOCQX_02935 [Candidatus Nanoarchaeia archaeon]
MAEKQKIVAKAIIEMLGSPKEHIENTMKYYVDKIEEDYKEIKVLDNHFEPAEETENSTEKAKLYSVFSEVELEIAGAENLAWFCIDYMPSSIDIIEPEKITYEARDFTGFINDLLSKLHQIGSQLKRLNVENKNMSKNSVKLIKNMILIQLKEKDKTIEELNKESGLEKEHLKKYLNHLINEGRITQKKDSYGLK